MRSALVLGLFVILIGILTYEITAEPEEEIPQAWITFDGLIGPED